MAKLTGQDATIEATDSAVLAYTVTDDGLSTGTPKDLSSGSATWIMTSAAGTVTVTKTTDDGIVISGASSEVVTVTLTTTDTAVTAGAYTGDLQVTDSASQTRTVATGTITIT